MDYQSLQNAVMEDLKTIPELKMGILSARDFYGSFVGFILKFSLILVCINVFLQMGLHSIGLYYPSFSFTGVLFMWGLTLAGTSFIAIFLSPLVLFRQLVKGRLKSEGFINQKCKQAAILYLVIYSVIYGAISLAQAPTNLHGFEKAIFDKEGWRAFSFIIAELWSLLGAFMLANVVANLEINRLGVGVAFDVVQAFVARVKVQPTQSLHSIEGGDDAR